MGGFNLQLAIRAGAVVCCVRGWRGPVGPTVALGAVRLRLRVGAQAGKCYYSTISH